MNRIRPVEHDDQVLKGWAVPNKYSEVQQLLDQKNWQEERGKLRSLVLDCGLDEEVKWGKLCYTF